MQPLKIIYEDDSLLVIDKPAGMNVWNEGMERGDSVATMLLGQYPELEKLGEARRYGIVHRLDKDTSGILLVAKTPKLFEFLQQQFKTRETVKRYLCLATGKIDGEKGIIHTQLGRSPADRRKQKAYPLTETKVGTREAITEYRVVQRLKDPLENVYALLEVTPKTGRKHQIRAHLAHLQHPIAGDKLYGFKNQPTPEGLERQFLHASYLKVNSPDGATKEFASELPKELKKILESLQQSN